MDRDEPGGIALPSLATYPDPKLRSSLPPAEWEACLDLWISSVEFRLRLRDDEFSNLRWSRPASGVEFLASLFRWHRREEGWICHPSKQDVLFKRAYLLLRRFLVGTPLPFDYEGAKLLDLLCSASSHFGSMRDWRETVKGLWTKNGTQMTSLLGIWKSVIAGELTNQLVSPELVEKYRQCNALLKISANTGLVFMTGSDYWESLIEAFDRVPVASRTAQLRKILTEHAFYCLRSLTSDGTSHPSLLLDHLFHLLSAAERISKTKRDPPTLCSSLVCTTSLLRHLTADEAVHSGKRGQGLLESLTRYRQETLQLHLCDLPPARRAAKGKGKGKADAAEEMHMHQAAQLSQVHELFPDLSNHYILQLLDRFGHDTEAVVAALLEPKSLPSDLQDPDDSHGPSVDANGPKLDLLPRPTPPSGSQRRTVFDGDDFDNLRISSRHVHRGRKDVTIQDETQDEHTKRKAAIMAALAKFDSDDDERDDTYDIADVGGTVDSTLDTDTRPRDTERNPHEESLFRAWKDNPELFARDSKTRISPARQDLKSETALSDEQIEGWAIILKRDDKLQDSLERKYSSSQAFRGQQKALPSAKWSGNMAEGRKESELADGSRHMGQAQARGGRSFGRGRGGSTAGPTGDAATQAARRRKEQGKGRGGANHGRREGRGRKIGRGMAGPLA